MKLSSLGILAVAASVPVLAVSCGSSGGTTTLSTSSTSGSGGASTSGSTGGAGTGLTTSSTGATGGATSSASSSSGSAIDAGLTDFCNGAGAIPIPGTSDCTGDIGKKVFLYAMCSCTDLTTHNTLDTDSLNSGNAPKALEGGSVGVNGNYSADAPTSIKGALIVDGAFSSNNAHDVVQDFRAGGTIHVGAPSTADSDAYLASLVVGPPGDLTVTGKVYSPAAGNASQVHALGAFTQASVVTPHACDCSKPVDIAGIVAAFKGTNDNVANGVQPDALTAMPEYPKDLTLPCGRYYLSGVSVNQTVNIHLLGRTVLAIEGDITVSGPFTLDLAPGAELDLFVTGNVDFMNTAAIGSTMKAAATRGYIAGSQVLLQGPLTLGGNLYLPNATFHVTNALEMWGAVFANAILSDGPVKVHYDEAVLDLNGCQPPTALCGDCHDCANPTPACGPGGTCGACTQNKDCCPPLICDTASGDCVQPLPK